MALTPVPFQGSSMNPLFKGADHLLVDFFAQPVALPSPEVLVGDVVLYKQPQGEWVCHRYLGMSPEGAVFKGDYNTTLEIASPSVAWGVIKGFTLNESVFAAERLIAAQFICDLQKKQCEQKVFVIKKLYRLMSLSLLLVNRFFSIKKYNHFKS